MKLLGATACLLFCTAASAQPEEATLTYAQASQLSVEALAHIVLGMSGTGIVAARFPVLLPPAGYRLATIEFTKTPHPAGFPRLCEADILTVYLGPKDKTWEGGDPPVVVGNIAKETRYRYLAEDQDAVAGAKPSDPEACHANAGEHDTGQISLFQATYKEQSGWAAAALLGARALAQVNRSSQRMPIRCKGEDSSDRAACDLLRSRLAQVTTADIGGVGIDACDKDKAHLCVETSIPVVAGGTDNRTFALVLHTRVPVGMEPWQFPTDPQVTVVDAKVWDIVS